MVPGEPPAPLAVAVDHLAELAPNGVPDATAKTPTVGAAYLGHENPPLSRSAHRRAHGATDRRRRQAAKGRCSIRNRAKAT